MNINFNVLIEIICEILDVEANKVELETYVLRELGAESIDLLELAVTFSDRFKIEVIDADIFLGSLRIYLEESKEENMTPAVYLEQKYPFLSSSRINEILTDLEEGPVLKVKDLLNYVEYKSA